MIKNKNKDIEIPIAIDKLELSKYNESAKNISMLLTQIVLIFTILVEIALYDGLTLQISKKFFSGSESSFFL